MAKRGDKERLPSQGPYVKLHKGTIESLAWRELSHGAKCLFVELWSKTDNADHRSYLSYREASSKLKASRHKVREWFAELEHYGFIVMLQRHSLGVDGRGKASLWRVTDKGTVRGGYEPPTNDFLKWTGEVFDPTPYRDKRGATRWEEKQYPGSPVRARVVPPSEPPLVPASEPGKGMSGSRVRAIHNKQGGSRVRATTSLTTRGASVVPFPNSRNTSKPWLPHFARCSGGVGVAEAPVGRSWRDAGQGMASSGGMTGKV